MGNTLAEKHLGLACNLCNLFLEELKLKKKKSGRPREKEPHQRLRGCGVGASCCQKRNSLHHHDRNLLGGGGAISG